MVKDPSRVFAADSPVGDFVPFAHLVSPLIIEADGTTVPLQYGFARQYSLGNINEARLFTLASQWRQKQYPAFHRLCQRVFRQLTKPKRVAMLNWYEQISTAASRHTPRRISRGAEPTGRQERG